MARGVQKIRLTYRATGPEELRQQMQKEIKERRQRGQENWFTDRLGLEGEVDCVAVMKKGKAHRKWLKDLATVYDKEVKGIAIALKNTESNNILILTDL